MAKKKSSVPENETDAQRFKRVVEPRVGKALKAIGLVSSVSGSAYKHTDAQVATIITALREGVDKAEKRFQGVGGASDGFSL